MSLFLKRESIENAVNKPGAIALCVGSITSGFASGTHIFPKSGLTFRTYPILYLSIGHCTVPTASLVTWVVKTAELAPLFHKIDTWYFAEWENDT